MLTRSACYRPLTVDGIPLIGPVPDAPGAFLATGHASWGILNAPATGRMVSEMILDGGSRAWDAIQKHAEVIALSADTTKGATE